MSESAFIERALEPSVANADARFRSCDAEANGGSMKFLPRAGFVSFAVERAALPKKTMVSGRAPAPSDRSRARAPRLALGARFDGAGGTRRARRARRAASGPRGEGRGGRPRVRRPRVVGRVARFPRRGRREGAAGRARPARRPRELLERRRVRRAPRPRRRARRVRGQAPRVRGGAPRARRRAIDDTTAPGGEEAPPPAPAPESQYSAPGGK